MAVKPRRRENPRVEPGRKTVLTASAQKPAKQGEEFQRPEGFIKFVDGEVLIGAQLAETVPVVDYGNVVLGPVHLMWKLGGVNMHDLLDVDWSKVEDSDDLDSMTKEQKAAFQRVRQALRASMVLCEFTVAEDRETVENAVRWHKEQAAKEKKGK